MPRILVTNDDGIYSEGLRKLAEACRDVGEVTIVAPDREQSAASHALTLNRPLRLLQIEENEWIVDGTPTDCVNLAVLKLMKDARPDLIVSGINFGPNLGDDVTYSGTVSAALEGALLSIPSIAVSTQNRRNGDFEFGPGAKAAAAVSEAVLQRGMPKFTLLNINVPFGPNKGFKVTVQAKRNHITVVSERIDPRNRPYYWIEEGHNDWEPHDQSDWQAVRDGYISITPLQPDMTAHHALKYVEGLPLVTEANVR